jgi:hypothetical protein
VGIVPRSIASNGYMDLDKDDYKDGDVFKMWQEIALETTKSIVECESRARSTWLHELTQNL